MSEEGGVFPVQVQQKGLRTFGWPNYLSSYGFDEFFCALTERYTAVGLVPPVVTLDGVSFSIVTEADRLVLINWMYGKDADYLNQIVQQIQDSVLALAGLYYDQFSVPLTSEVMLSWGLKTSGATWPEGLEHLDVAFANLQYTKNEFPNRAYSVDFADKVVTEGFPYVQAVVPVSTVGSVSDESIVTNFVSASGRLKEVFYQTNQKIVVALKSFRRWCMTGFYRPCVGEDSVVVVAAESGTVDTSPPEQYENLNIVEKVITFNLSGLCSSLRYVLASNTLGGDPVESKFSVTYDENGSTGGSAPVDSNSPYNPNSLVTVLGKDGAHFFRLEHSQQRKWSNLQWW
jgi:hypothetical protein